MRRLLAILLASGPLVAAALTPDAGVVLFDDSTDKFVINAEACASTTREVSLKWQVKPDASFTTGGKFNVFVASKDFGATSPYCYTPSDTGVNVRPVTLAGNPDIEAPTASYDALKVLTSDLASVTGGAACDAGTFTTYVCVQWLDSGGNVKGYAKGTASVELDGPPAPTVDSDVGIGDTRLKVTITPAAGTPATAKFRAKATNASDALDVHLSALTPVDGTAVIEGLTNDVGYNLTAIPYSAVGNPGDESDPPIGPYIPKDVLDAWELYVIAGGRDSGGTALLVSLRTEVGAVHARRLPVTGRTAVKVRRSR